MTAFDDFRRDDFSVYGSRSVARDRKSIQIFSFDGKLGFCLIFLNY